MPPRPASATLAERRTSTVDTKKTVLCRLMIGASRD
jgi:hypothetical protein